MSLKEEFQQAGLPIAALDDFDGGCLEWYYSFLCQENTVGGFFSAGDAHRILERHFFEALVFARESLRCFAGITGHNVSRETRILDAGTGPGLPGFLFHAHQSRPDVTLLDSSRRRLGLLEAHLKKSERSMQFPRFCYERLEEHNGIYDLIIMRALIPFPACMELICQLQNPGGMVSLSLGVPPLETPAMREYLAALGYVSRETIQPPDLEFLGKRSFKILLKASAPRKPYPRNWKRIKESIQEWTES